jgi:hypothetical protein
VKPSPPETKETKMGEYIDVRGPWPVYTNGVIAIELTGQLRNITVVDARRIAKTLKK